MPRAARVVVAGLPHRVTQRGNNHQDVGHWWLNFTGELGGGGSLESQVLELIAEMMESEDPESLVAELVDLLGLE